ncbi:MAG: Rieske 2Fe-2S domain-containing protein [Burkholderiales bacterium]
MLTHEENQRLTQVGPGTPMGSLLRRYWHPVGTMTELDQTPVMPVRILGEDLVLFRNEQGAMGLLDRRCAHRGVSLEFGMPEDRGLRCPYHGWLYDRTGQCLEQPAEFDGKSFCHKVRIKAYPVEALGGLVWAYLGPQPAPLLPRYDLFVREDYERSIGITRALPCNWFQMMENSLDPVHLEYLHGIFYNYVLKRQGKPPRAKVRHHLRIGFDVFEQGIIKRRILEGQTEESDEWKIGHPILFPNILAVGDYALPEFQIRVPIDDTHTQYYWYRCKPRDGNAPVQQSIPVWDNPYQDENGHLIVDTINGHDLTIFIAQGVIADRTNERLGTSDAGVVLLRKVFREQIEKIERGEDPMAVVRDSAKNRIIDVPREHKAHYTISGDFYAKEKVVEISGQW